jgi:hypothetical protein
MAHHRFTIELDVPDDDDNADDPEWWADAAAGACTEYGAENVIFTLDPPEGETLAGGVTQPDAWLISIEDGGDQYRYVFTDPAWAEWLRSYEPTVGPDHSVGLTLDNIPPTLAEMIRAMSPDELEERDLLTDDAPQLVGSLTSGSYSDDKIHFVSQFCQRAKDVTELRQWNIVGEFSTIAY